jgi:hypothetical protein
MTFLKLAGQIPKNQHAGTLLSMKGTDLQISGFALAYGYKLANGDFNMSWGCKLA